MDAITSCTVKLCPFKAMVTGIEKPATTRDIFNLEDIFSMASGIAGNASIVTNETSIEERSADKVFLNEVRKENLIDST